MIDNILVYCSICHHKTGLEPAENIISNSKSVKVIHSDTFSTVYNGAYLKQDDIVSIIFIPGCIHCK